MVPADTHKDFYVRVRQVVGRIPSGKVTTYGTIAAHLGVASGARMVGYALKGSKSDIPAHRVLNRLGQLSGRHQFPDDTMRERLEQEGIRFTSKYTVDIDRHFWDPHEEDDAN